LLKFLVKHSVTPVGMRGQPLPTITSSETDFMSIILASYPTKLLDKW